MYGAAFGIVSSLVEMYLSDAPIWSSHGTRLFVAIASLMTADAVYWAIFGFLFAVVVNKGGNYYEQRRRRKILA